jgi:hypothetical protein
VTTKGPTKDPHAVEIKEGKSGVGKHPDDQDANDPRNAAFGIPVARPDPDKPYPEPDVETRATQHTADVAAKEQEQGALDKAAADKAAKDKAAADADAKAKAKE